MAKRKSRAARRREQRQKAKEQRTPHDTTLPEASDDDDDDDLLAAAAAWAQHDEIESPPPNKKKKRPSGQRLPPDFPANLPVPKGFLRDEEPYRRAFQVALETAYEGFVWDKPDTFPERDIQSALLKMDSLGIFRTDVTQPAGLGGKCVKTYVTRCLLGDEGTTYKYLGLRMFSHPWNPKVKETTASTKEAKGAFDTIWNLNTSLTSQTEKHLVKLDQQRLKRNEDPPTVQGRAGYHVTLINKMKASPRLKDEPMYGTGQKCSVSWHADSSLEHFSTIAVYQTIVPPKEEKSRQSQQRHSEWSVALRVTHNAEGPKAKRLGDISVLASSPPICAALPSGTAYYMLDDSNHHHQHAVLAPDYDGSADSSIRFSSTHRLLRVGHTVQHVLERCETACSDFHRNGPKRWKSEQGLLNEIEFEWLRQFFIQGSENKRLLWGYWQGPILKLFEYWEKLETRTREVVLLLQRASEHRCGLSAPDVSSKAQRANRIKAMEVVHAIMGNQNAKGPLYDSLSTILKERSKKRELWLQREHDSVFKRMPRGCRPILFPVSFRGQSSRDKDEDCFASSPMPSSDVSEHIMSCGIAYEKQQRKFLPTEDLFGT